MLFITTFTTSTVSSSKTSTRNIWHKIYYNISMVDVLLTFHLLSDNVPRETISIPFAARTNDWGKWICGRLSRFLKDARMSLMPAPGNTIPVRRLLNEKCCPLIAGEMINKQTDIVYNMEISISSLWRVTIKENLGLAKSFTVTSNYVCTHVCRHT